MKNLSLAAIAVLVIVAGLCQAGEVTPPAEPMSVWFVSPARSFHESCPLGNGRLGAMDFGGVGRERIALNESSLWSGGPYDGNRYDAYQCLPEVREKLFAGDISAAGGALDNGFRYADGVSGWGDGNQFGCYQTLGDLIVDFAPTPVRTFQVAEIALADGVKPPPAVAGDGYRRDLNLMQGVAHTQYRRDGVTFTRDLVVSKPDEVIALCLKADKPGCALVDCRSRAQAECGPACRRRRASPRRPIAVQQARRRRQRHALPGIAGGQRQGWQAVGHGSRPGHRRRG